MLIDTPNKVPYKMRGTPIGHPKQCVAEHVLIAEKALGHYLPAGAEVHHVDRNRKNNKNSNLVICQDRSYHRLLHVRAEALRACGHVDWRKCKFCKQYSPVAELDMGITRRNGYEPSPYHQICNTRYAAEARRRKGKPEHPWKTSRGPICELVKAVVRNWGSVRESTDIGHS